MGTNGSKEKSVHLSADYQKLFNTVKVTSASAEAALVDAPVFRLSGELAADGSLTNLIYRAVQGLETTPQDTASAYTLVFGTGAQTLSEFRFSPSRPDYSIEGAPESYSSGFYVVAPLPSGTTWVEVRRSGVMIDRFEQSAHAPTVQLVSPNGGQNYAPNDVVTVQWSSFDQEGDTLKYGLFYSPDDGLTWIPLASAFSGKSYTWDLGNLRGSGFQQARLRVTASDGFFTATDESDADFTVGGKPPVAVINAPVAGAALRSCSLLSLDGSAYDPEGQLSLTQWMLDETLVSTQTLDTIPMPEAGSHNLVFRVEDADGQLASQSLAIIVVEDSDCDDLPDAYETVNSFNIYDPTDAGLDADKDGLSNRQEYWLGTLPRNPDTDGDGYSDGAEYQAGTDPLDPKSMPRSIYLPFMKR
jgi:hypothetical protein